MSQLPLGLGKSEGGDPRRPIRIGVTDGALGDDISRSVASQFPQVRFQSAGATWPDRPGAEFDILIVEADASAPDAAARRLKSSPGGPRIVVVLHNADITVSRQLAREGATDVLPAPVSETALALCLERLLQREDDGAGEGPARAGEVVAFIKAGGGVGATSLAAQAAVMLARRGAGGICLADLDLQFGAAAAYLDLPDAFNLLDALNLGQTMETAHLSSILAEHRSGLRVLAAPKDMSPIDAVKPAQIDALIALLRSEYDLSLLDLPSVWTTWSLRAVADADRIVLVGQLTVPSIQLIGRQLRFLSAQKLDDRPITLVCNGCSPDQLAGLPLKVAEKSIGRPFDVMTPLDVKTMTAAVNQGRPLDETRRGTKLEKAIGQLADKLRATAPAATARRWF